MKRAARHRLYLPALLLFGLSACADKDSSRPESQVARTEPAAHQTAIPREPDAARPERLESMRVLRSLEFRGCCDGSGGAALTGELFVVVNDEDSVLRVYDRRLGGTPVVEYDARRFLDLKKGEEADLEAAARIEDAFYFIGSHARGNDGDKKKNRRQLFSLKFQISDNRVDFTPNGKPYTDLLEDLIESPALASLGLEQASKEDGDKASGLNIEGLCSTPEGHLLLGFRGPIVNGKTLLVHLTNPGEVVQGRRAQFGEPVLLDLRGKGIRGIERARDQYFIVAELEKDGDSSALYQWDGWSNAPTLVQTTPVHDFNPESLIVYSSERSPNILLLMDDGNRSIGGEDCKDVQDKRLRRFRAFWLEP